MYISYFDETGDDGFPQYSSELFVLTSIYLHYQNWKKIYERIIVFKQHLKTKFNFPIKTEIHTKKLLLNKVPYRQFNWTEEVRLDIVKDIALFAASLEDVKSINVCISKKKIISQPQNDYYKHILDRALCFNVQRIENSIKRIDHNAKFIIITDEGRVGMMQQTVRKIQRINFIPSKFGTPNYRQEIKLLIEDPLPKNSSNSYFIQIADFISYFVYLKLIGKQDWHNRLVWLTQTNLDEIITILKPVFNLDASRDNEYGFVCYPK